MSEVTGIKKKTSRILLIFFLIVFVIILVFSIRFLNWFTATKAGRIKKLEKELERKKKKTRELVNKMEEKFIDFHIKHTNDRVIYDEKCEVCKSCFFWN